MLSEMMVNILWLFISDLWLFPFLVSECWLYYALRVWKNIFITQRLLTGQCPLLPWSRYTSRHSTPLPGPGGSHRAPPSWSWAPVEHLPTRCLYAGSGSPCGAEATWQSTAKWDKIFLLCGLHSVENIIKHGCFTMFCQI